jgi:hypothetical protein
MGSSNKVSYGDPSVLLSAAMSLKPEMIVFDDICSEKDVSIVQSFCQRTCPVFASIQAENLKALIEVFLF